MSAWVLLSGGQDSLVCLLWARRKFPSVRALNLGYGQRHAVERSYARRLAERYRVPLHLYELATFFSGLAPSALTGTLDLSGSHPLAASLPASFVPGRNGVLLTVAALHAYAEGPGPIDLVIGACETDYSGYPDCRQDYLDAKAKELSLGLERQVSIHSPLMRLDKAAVFAQADAWGELVTLIEETMTCYAGTETLHPWGRGCDACPACALRRSGYEHFRAGN